MANTLTVSGDATYAGIPLDVDLIQFLNAIHTAATATFAVTDFNGSRIHVDAAIEGTLGGNHIVVNGGSLDASAWTFTAWNDLLDRIRINGSGGDDAITGSLRADTITGGLGADALVGGDGNDTFVYNSDDEIAASETVDGGAGTADALRIATSDSYDFRIMAAPGSVEQLEFDTASGGSTARFNSSQFGGSGMSDNLAVTGDGNPNTIAIHTLSDAFFSAAGWTFTNWTAGNGLIRIFGTGAAETIIGSSQRNIITGGVGADILTGGDADDSFTYTDSSELPAGETVDGKGGTDNIALGGTTASYDLSGVTLSGIEALSFADTVTLKGDQIGSGVIISVSDVSAGARVLIVNGALVNLGAVTFTGWTAGEDTIIINGTAGNDSLTGSNQFDTFNGGLGDDTYVLGADNDAVNDTGGIDTITSTVSRDLSAFATIENLTLLGAAANGTGNGLANTIVGNANANTLDGAGGSDTMRGLGGNDTYVVDNIGDVVDESAADSGGIDTILASANIDLGGGTAKFVSLAPAAAGIAAVENLTLTGNAAEATGNSLANVITGNASANTLDGGDGADSLLGGDGADRLIGGLGPDQLTGGLGADSFVLLSLLESGKKAPASDTILDFTAEDFIDLSAIDAKTGGKDNKFKFIKKQGFHDKKGELHYQKKGGDLVVSGDVNGDGKADFSMLLDNAKKLVAGDFVL